MKKMRLWRAVISFCLFCELPGGDSDVRGRLVEKICSLIKGGRQTGRAANMPALKCVDQSQFG